MGGYIITNTFFISDTHFGHTNTACVFKRDDGTPLRPFKSVEEQDETLIKNWNDTVKPNDRVYHLGDFAMPRRSLKIFHRLQGRIALVLGNHDPWRLSDYKDFKNLDHLLGSKAFPGLGWIATHIPVSEQQLQHRFTINLHGHLHYRKMLDKHGKEDKRYFNCSVECIDYKPIEIEEIKKQLD